MATILRSITRASITGVAKEVGQAVPLVGTAVALGLLGYEIKRKGLFKGMVNTALNATPVLGVTKNVLEVFTGAWLADKPSDEAAEPPPVVKPD